MGSLTRSAWRRAGPHADGADLQPSRVPGPQVRLTRRPLPGAAAARPRLHAWLRHLGRYDIAPVWAPASTVAMRAPSCHDHCTQPARWWRVPHACSSAALRRRRACRGPPNGLACGDPRVPRGPRVMAPPLRLAPYGLAPAEPLSPRAIRPFVDAAGVHHAGRPTPSRRNWRPCGVVSAVMDVEPAVARAACPVVVTLPRSRTPTTSVMPTRGLSLSTWAGPVSGAAVWPSNTCTAMGSPSAMVLTPIPIGAWPGCLARLSPQTAHDCHAHRHDRRQPSQSRRDPGADVDRATRPSRRAILPATEL